MGVNVLNQVLNGAAAVSGLWNDLRDAFLNDFVGRDSNGNPISGKNLGNSLYPWGKIFVGSLVIDRALTDLTGVIESNPYKIISGKTRTTSNQPAFLTPAGSGNGRSLTIVGTSVPLIYEIGEDQVTLSLDK